MMAQDSAPSAPEPGKNCGIPGRTPISTSLWAHLLRKDTARGQSPNLGPVLPPITPLDKNGTSMRILLHDTQAHLDRFSERADKLFSRIDETKQEISIVNTLFQREHETLTEELVDLVNRSQTQLQNSIGTPAQNEQLGRLSKDINAHLEAIDKRLDAINSFNQTHSQMLQLQSQAIQSLQEQHGSMLTALIPLLPLLRTIPLHIESARNKITDILTKPAAPSITQIKPFDQNCDRSSANVQRCRSKRSSSTLGSDSPSSPSDRKKARIDTTPRTGENRLSNPIPVPSIVTDSKPGEFGSSLRGSMPPASASSRLTRQETTVVPSPRFTPPMHHQISAPEQIGHIGVSSSPSSFPSSIPSSSKGLPLIPRDSASFRSYVDLSEKGSLTVQASNATRPPPMLLFSGGFATPSSDLTRPAPRVPTRRLWLTTQKSREESPKQIPKTPTSSSSPQSNMRSAKHIKPNNLAPHSIHKPSTILIGPACHPAQHFPAIQHPGGNSSRPSTRTALCGTSEIRTPNAPVQRLHGQTSTFLPDQFRKSFLAPITASSPVFAPQQAKIRERRSLRKEGRRFIPLDDSDDDDADFGNG